MERIFVVDDDRQLQRVLKRLFESEGYHVEAKADGKSALEALHRAPPAAVVLDLGLPDIPGAEVCRVMREQSADVPIVILSAETNVLTKVRLLELGADDYITKPFSPRELLARVRTAIRHAPKIGVHDVVTFDSVRVDFTSMDATLDDEPVGLTSVEFKVLKLLVRNAGRVASRKELFREALCASDRTPSHSITNYIYHLRHKLERDPLKPAHFLTVHGMSIKYAHRTRILRQELLRCRVTCLNWVSRTSLLSILSRVSGPILFLAPISLLWFRAARSVTGPSLLGSYPLNRQIAARRIQLRLEPKSRVLWFRGAKLVSICKPSFESAREEEGSGGSVMQKGRESEPRSQRQSSGALVHKSRPWPEGR